MRPRELQVRDTASSAGDPPPHDLDSEIAVLSAAILEPGVVDELATVLREEDFYSPANRLIWSAIIWLAGAGEPIDFVTIGRRLKDVGKLSQVGGQPYLARITDAAPSLAQENLAAYVRGVTSRSRARAMIRAAQQIAADGYKAVDIEDYVQRAEAAVVAIASDGGDAAKQPRLLKGIVRDTFQDMENRAKGLVIPVASGFRDLDDLLVSETGEVQIVAARPGMGKTSFVMDVVKNAAKAATPAASVVFSLEMQDIPLVKRMVASEAGVDLGDIRRGRLSSGQWDELTKAATRLAALPVAIDSVPGISVVAMRSKFRQAKAKLLEAFPDIPVRICVVDYLQLMGRNPNSNAGNREQEVSEISRALSVFSLEEDVLVIALSQLNRSVESRQDKRPGMADLRESGAIEQDATSILFLYRDEQYDPNSKDKGLCEVIVGKSRNGDTNRVMLAFDRRYTRFRNHDGDPQWLPANPRPPPAATACAPSTSTSTSSTSGLERPQKRG